MPPKKLNLGLKPALAAPSKGIIPMVTLPINKEAASKPAKTTKISEAKSSKLERIAPKVAKLVPSLSERVQRVIIQQRDQFMLQVAQAFLRIDHEEVPVDLPEEQMMKLWEDVGTKIQETYLQQAVASVDRMFTDRIAASRDKEPTSRDTEPKQPAVAPKRQKTGFQRFKDSKTREFKTENLDKQELTAKIQKLWEELSEEQKQKYEPKPAEADTPKEKEKKKRDPAEPKKPLSAYMLFQAEHRESLKEEKLSFAEAGKRLGEMWAKLDDAQKEKYNAQNAEAKAKYEVDIQEYKSTHPAATEAADPASKKAKVKTPKDPLAPKKPLSAFLIFSGAQRSSVKEDGMSIGDVAKKLGELWKAMDDAEKEVRMVASTNM
eukprot:TRINITY_DN11388_c0_g1_i2.p1 TRINITY_DN11388_c0_g1~~TRINITY_DN11388_c0_g1_i2.p1  ORF type:complete len:377 (+),score=82.15 TRINITY_DN11388_c0_g1_i2:97-1227(+)